MGLSEGPGDLESLASKPWVNRADSWITQVWTKWVHLYRFFFFFSSNYWKHYTIPSWLNPHKPKNTNVEKWGYGRTTISRFSTGGSPPLNSVFFKGLLYFTLERFLLVRRTWSAIFCVKLIPFPQRWIFAIPDQQEVIFIIEKLLLCIVFPFFSFLNSCFSMWVLTPQLDMGFWTKRSRIQSYLRRKIF